MFKIWLIPIFLTEDESKDSEEGGKKKFSARSAKPQRPLLFSQPSADVIHSPAHSQQSLALPRQPVIPPPKALVRNRTSKRRSRTNRRQIWDISITLNTHTHTHYTHTLTHSHTHSYMDKATHTHRGAHTHTHTHTVTRKFICCLMFVCLFILKFITANKQTTTWCSRVCLSL